ncbi:putative pyrophosphatase [Desulfosporosinus orientis DSM 765]|uniref:Putative pyrophosphatase n=1 Tax=Desulfosporosinus orientis (strain ATCC 19365 / DSM 765 / NCIMB 8382 / VKM B-1628 / Singapore I) TaxID=768706 RepID=G7W9A0_DESOD|nr:nucleotide pyrophosphohydrolase [Desulfosporosinus orientis]AET68741.1 putative pyrophosphatase [Desulfosporosinus orientis DSM 765]
MNELIQKVVKFRDLRNWKQYHNPKDLAISLSIEASELLENFQWKTSEESVSNNYARIQDELADVLIYALLLSNELKIDPQQAIIEKMKKNGEKYPVEKAYGSNKKYNEL